MKRGLIAAALVTGGCAGVTFYICDAHCYRWRVESSMVQDVDEDGYFDDVCINHHNNLPMDVPIPNLGFPGQRCLGTQAEHETIKTVIAAKLADDLGSLSQAQIDTYEDFIEGLALNIQRVCIDRLTCNKQFCDIDPTQSADQACTELTASSLCHTHVRSIVENALELFAGPEVPQYSQSPGAISSLDPCDYIPEGTGDGTGGSSGGAPFGDLETLASCIGTTCTVSQQLLDNITDNRDIFAAENVALTYGTHTLGTGLLLSGLAVGDESKELADFFGLRNNDVITHFNGVALSTEATLLMAANVVLDLSYSGHATFLVKRRSSPDLLYEISLNEASQCANVGDPCADSDDCCGQLICNTSDVCGIPLF